MITTGKKKDTVVCWQEIGSFLLRREIFITTGKKKDTLRPEKKRYSHLSDGYVVLAITTGKKKDTVVCLLVARFWQLRPEKKDTVLCLMCCAVVLFFVVAGYDRKKKVPVVCLAKEKRYSRLSVGYAVLTITTGKKKIQSSVWRVVLLYCFL